MTGRIGGRRNSVRYYHVNRVRQSPRTDHPLKAFIPAEPLEKAVLAVVREILIHQTDLHGAIERAMRKRAAEQREGSTDRSALEKELNRRQRQIASAIDNLSGDEAADRPIQERLMRYQADVARIMTALRTTPQPSEPIDINSIADRVAAELADLADALTADDLPIIRQIISLVVARMEVDMKTRETELELHIPDWLAASLSRQPRMGLDAVLACRAFNETHPSDGSEIASFRCKQTAKRPVCFQCHRIRRAA